MAVRSIARLGLFGGSDLIGWKRNNLRLEYGTIHQHGNLKVVCAIDCHVRWIIAVKPNDIQPMNVVAEVHERNLVDVPLAGLANEPI